MRALVDGQDILSFHSGTTGNSRSSFFAGLIGLLSSTMKVKMMVYKRAFLTIGDQAMGQEKNVTVPTSSRLPHSKLLGEYQDHGTQGNMRRNA